MELICDSREQFIKPIKPLLPEWVKIDTIVTGDFAIKFNGEVKYLFERKTWSDFSNSIKDGRLEEQTQRLLDFGCPVYIIYEGTAFPGQNTVISGIEFSKLDAMRRKLIMLGINPIQTKDTVDTIFFLTKFAEQYATFQEKKTGASEKKLKEKVASTIEELVEKVWLSIPGVGKNIIPNLKAFKLMSILDKTISVDELAKTKYVTSNRKLGLAKAGKILEFDQQKLLSEFPGLSKDSAKYLLEKYYLVDLLALDEHSFAEVNKTDSRKIGAATAKKFFEICNFCIQN